ncbi:MAG: hypothetical protein IJS14_10820 [Lentisphaeria bacterium]|nr:hypothetical protein [Lentisphaeria bacterium]
MNKEEFIVSTLEMFDFAVRAAERWQKDHPEDTSKSDVLCRRTLFSFLLRNTSSERTDFPPEAVEFLKQADLDWPAAIEKFRRELPAIAVADYEGAMKHNPKFAPGMSVRPDKPNPALPRNWCIIHMWNAISPKSFLNEQEYFAKCLLRVMDESEKEYGYDTLYTFTWLNAVPRYLRFFPQEWQDNLGEPSRDIYANLGFLGQFLTARRTLNKKTAEQYLATGELPFKPRKSHCSYAAARKHLQQFI